MKKRTVGVLMALALMFTFSCGSSNTVGITKENNFEEKDMFSTVDLNGKEWTSEELFKNNKLTLVNFWGTTCPPCIKEMPELEKLSKVLEEKGCGVLGIITDGSEYGSEAQEIINMTGVTFPNVFFNEEIYKLFHIQVTPTTYFIDNNGKVVGSPIYGARNTDMYLQEFNEHLDLIK